MVFQNAVKQYAQNQSHGFFCLAFYGWLVYFVRDKCAGGCTGITVRHCRFGASVSAEDVSIAIDAGALAVIRLSVSLVLGYSDLLFKVKGTGSRFSAGVKWI